MSGLAAPQVSKFRTLICIDGLKVLEGDYTTPNHPTPPKEKNAFEKPTNLTSRDVFDPIEFHSSKKKSNVFSIRLKPLPKGHSSTKGALLDSTTRILSVPLERPFELLGLKGDCKAGSERFGFLGEMEKTQLVPKMFIGLYSGCFRF